MALNGSGANFQPKASATFARDHFALLLFPLCRKFRPMTLTEQMTALAKQARASSRELAKLSTDEKNRCLIAMADALEKNADAIKTANSHDMEAGAQMGLSSAMLDRLKLDAKRIAGMAKGLREVAALGDPVGKVLDDRTRPNGLRLKKISTPIGVVVIIYESRPNVTADAASLCFKSGNATILRGGKEAMHSNQIIAATMVEAGRKALANFPLHAIQVVATRTPFADSVRGPVHAAWRRRSYSRGNGMFQGACHQTLQRRLPRLRGSRRGFADG
jgi:acyl-CoA reductase-like NAD-dependent aldehyde dehydrogenase